MSELMGAVGLGFIFMALAILASPEQSPSSCYQIKDNDARHMCLAVAKHDKYHCYQIKDLDLRHSCLARVR